jgi:hypothetical protein
MIRVRACTRSDDRRQKDIPITGFFQHSRLLATATSVCPSLGNDRREGYESDLRAIMLSGTEGYWCLNAAVRSARMADDL